ncbi:NAD-dependent epimerase/dehydratase family protein [Paenibacillus pasadenensis]|uniref:NAD-dependent epimerase/dehydratase family protein n=1 Tax=Paenibacillus pasadenensis TaxID=217090 RepID=UPI00203AC412|nr:NAD-dependent epimerase/dehydratase family protein [Paenibacillus pasadenensis]MCM3747649.1 NAD-dependent epimerase/dehydratase family protein [Paenibacillus pasadenensis]
MTACLLLGGAGFIGSNLAELLHEQGHQVSIYDRNVEEKVESSSYDLIEGNFFEEQELERIIENHDVVIHLISSIAPASSMDNPRLGYEKDVIKALELLEICRSQSKKIIFISSGGTVYGRQDASPIRVEASTYPVNHYGITKLAIEKIMLMYNDLYQMENIILRVANPYGRGQIPNKRIGAISVFIDHILTGKTISIYGDGSTVRDYIEITDVCQAIALAVNYRVRSEVIPVFNVGTGTGISIKDIIRKIEEETYVEAQTQYLESRSFDVDYNVLDISQTVLELGFKPSIEINRGIQQCVWEFTSRIERL